MTTRYLRCVEPSSTGQNSPFVFITIPACRLAMTADAPNVADQPLASNPVRCAGLGQLQLREVPETKTVHHALLDWRHRVIDGVGAERQTDDATLRARTSRHIDNFVDRRRNIPRVRGIFALKEVDEGLQNLA